jgi:hypothetical protein
MVTLFCLDQHIVHVGNIGLQSSHFSRNRTSQPVDIKGTVCYGTTRISHWLIDFLVNFPSRFFIAKQEIKYCFAKFVLYGLLIALPTLTASLLGLALVL